MAFEISDRGYWCHSPGEKEYYFDPGFADAVAGMLEEAGAQLVADFGCGSGEYTRYLLDRGFECHAYDGNPNTKQISGGIAETLDLTIRHDFDAAFDWIVCLEVAEHIPAEFEDIFLKNISENAESGIILSWAHPGQGGKGHVNEREPEYVESRLNEAGFVLDGARSEVLRERATIEWFQGNASVFLRLSESLENL